MKDNPTPIRIAAFLTGDFPEGAANASRIKGYASALKELGHHITLLFLWQDVFSNSGINKSVSGTWEGIPYHFLNNKNQRPAGKIGKLFDTFGAIIRSSIYLIKNRKNIDIIFIYCPVFHYFFHIYFLSKLLRIPLIVEQTELMSSLYLQPGQRKGIFYQLNKFDEKIIHYFASHCIVISEKLYTHYEKRFSPERLHLIPILVDVERFKPGLPQQKMTIGYIGSFGVKDGIPHLLKATAEARKTIPQLKLRLIGFCENRPHIERLIYEFGMERSVEITGAVLYHEVPALLGGCDLLMMSRINTSYANYGFPTKLGEYLALGIPVIASKVSDIEKYIQHEENALLVDPENIHQLTSYIIKRYYEEERYTSMGLKGRAVVLKYFTHTQAAEKLIAICRQAIKK